MPVELRKRKAPAAPPPEPIKRTKKPAAPATKIKTKPSVRGASRKKQAGAVEAIQAVAQADAAGEPHPEAAEVIAATLKENAETGEAAAKDAEAREGGSGLQAKGAGREEGDLVDFQTFGGEVQTHDGKTVTLQELVKESKKGVVIFTYPRANTPGCTKQACAFRDGHADLSASGYTIYGLSGDSPKSNTSFVTKQSLPYTLLCDPNFSLIGAIGLQQGKDKRTKRGVWAVNTGGEVQLARAGGPLETVEWVKKLVMEG